MAPGPGVAFAVALGGAVLLLGVLTIWCWHRATTGPSDADEDPTEAWYDEATSLTREVQQLADRTNESLDQDRLRRRLLPLSNQLQGHVRTAPENVDERALRAVYDLGADCYRVGMEHTTRDAAHTGVFIEDKMAAVGASAEDVEALLADARNE